MTSWRPLVFNEKSERPWVLGVAARTGGKIEEREKNNNKDKERNKRKLKRRRKLYMQRNGKERWTERVKSEERLNALVKRRNGEWREGRKWSELPNPVEWKTHLKVGGAPGQHWFVDASGIGQPLRYQWDHQELECRGFG
jgi:hypothetical protein